MARGNVPEFYVHEQYARKMANSRFVGGMILGGLIVFTMPIYKVIVNFFRDYTPNIRKDCVDETVVDFGTTTSEN